MRSLAFFLSILLPISPHGFGFVSMRGSGTLRYQSKALRSSDNINESAADDFLSQMAGAINLKMDDKPYSGSKGDLLIQQAGEYDRQAVRAKIQNLILENPVTLMTFTDCPYCIKARSILEEKGCKYVDFNVDMLERESYSFRAELYRMTGRTSLPAIWIGGDFAGGCNDGPMGGLMPLNESGQLDQLLQKAGAW